MKIILVITGETFSIPEISDLLLSLLCVLLAYPYCFCVIKLVTRFIHSVTGHLDSFLFVQRNVCGHVCLPTDFVFRYIAVGTSTYIQH